MEDIKDIAATRSTHELRVLNYQFKKYLSTEAVGISEEKMDQGIFTLIMMTKFDVEELLLAMYESKCNMYVSHLNELQKLIDDGSRDAIRVWHAAVSAYNTKTMHSEEDPVGISGEVLYNLLTGRSAPQILPSVYSIQHQTLLHGIIYSILFDTYIGKVPVDLDVINMYIHLTEKEDNLITPMLHVFAAKHSAKASTIKRSPSALHVANPKGTESEIRAMEARIRHQKNRAIAIRRLKKAKLLKKKRDREEALAKKGLLNSVPGRCHGSHK